MSPNLFRFDEAQQWLRLAGTILAEVVEMKDTLRRVGGGRIQGSAKRVART